MSPVASCSMLGAGAAPPGLRLRAPQASDAVHGLSPEATEHGPAPLEQLPWLDRDREDDRAHPPDAPAQPVPRAGSGDATIEELRTGALVADAHPLARQPLGLTLRPGAIRRGAGTVAEVLGPLGGEIRGRRRRDDARHAAGAQLYRPVAHAAYAAAAVHRPRADLRDPRQARCRPKRSSIRSRPGTGTTTTPVPSSAISRWMATSVRSPGRATGGMTTWTSHSGGSGSGPTSRTRGSMAQSSARAAR